MILYCRSGKHWNLMKMYMHAKSKQFSLALVQIFQYFFDWWNLFSSFICLYYLAHAFIGSHKSKRLLLRNMTVTLVTWRSLIESLYGQSLGTSVVINKYFPETMTRPVIVFRRNFHSCSFYLIVNSDSLQDISLHLIR